MYSVTSHFFRKGRNMGMSNLDNIKLEVDNDKKMKDFISAQEMLKKMSERLNFSDEEKEIATNFLRCNNYYSSLLCVWAI